MILSIRTDGSETTVQTQMRLPHFLDTMVIFLDVLIFRTFMVMYTLVYCIFSHENLNFRSPKTINSPKDADGMANSVDPDQTAPLGAV